MTVYNGHLIAGGGFTTAGGTSANYIASWDGSTWSPLGSGTGDPYVYALTVYDGNLIAGGGFTTAGNKVSAYLGAWTKIDTLFVPVPLDSAEVIQVVTADLDLDTYTDVVYVGSLDTGLCVAWGQAGSPPLGKGGETYELANAALAVFHLNADTLPDIVAVTPTWVYSLLNNGDRTFSVDSVPNTGSKYGEAPQIAVGYLDDDSYPDVIVTPDRWFAGDGTGSFVSNPQLGISYTSVAIADMNGDGIDDLAVIRNDSAIAYVNDGNVGLTKTGAVVLPLTTYDLSGIVTGTDMTGDGFIDIVAVVSDTAVDRCGILLAEGDGSGGISELDTRIFAGTAAQVTTSDVNRDFYPDIVVSNAGSGEILIYMNNMGIGIDGSQQFAVGGGGDLYFALATADLDRNGQPDFVSGSAAGDYLVVSINNEPGEPVLEDELKVTGYDYTSLRITNPDGFVISRSLQTVAGSAYYRVDVDANGIIDDRAYDYNLQYGEYVMDIFPEPGSGPEPMVSMGIGIDGSQQMRIFKNYLLEVGRAVDTLRFHFPLEETPSFYPRNGKQTHSPRPVFDWTRTVDTTVCERYQFQLDRYYDFRSPIVNDSALTQPRFVPPVGLGIDSVYYWRVRSFDGATWGEYSHERAVYVGEGCCEGWMGNIDGSEDDLVTMGDLTVLIDHLFITLTPLACPEAGNVDLDADGLVTMGDLTVMIDNLFISLTPLPPCP